MTLLHTDDLGCECAWPVRDPEVIHVTTPADKRVMPSKTLLEGVLLHPFAADGGAQEVHGALHG